MTEAAHQMTSNPLPPAKRQPGSVGIGMGVDIRILDDAGKEVPTGTRAEICVRGENVTKGYLNNPSANESSFTKDGFFRTGDQGMKDPDGYVIITGRIKELINKGGEKISPIEVDNTLLSHPKVAEAVSFAIADEGHYGEDIGAAVVLKNEGGASENDLKSWVADKLAKFKIPKQVCIPVTNNLVISHTDVDADTDCTRSGSCHKSPKRLLERSSDARWPRPCSRPSRSCRQLYHDHDCTFSAMAHDVHKMSIHTYIHILVFSSMHICQSINQSITLQTNPHSRFKLIHNPLAMHSPHITSQYQKGKKIKENIPE